MSGIISDNVGRATGLIKAAGGGGKIGQVLQTVHTGTESGSGNTAATIPNFTVAITPVATSSKILITVNAPMSSSNVYTLMLQLFRDTTSIYVGDAASARAQVSSGVLVQHPRQVWNNPIMYLDSPSLDVEIEYSVKWFAQTGTAQYIGRTFTDTDSVEYPRWPSSITVMEVLA